MPDDKQQLEDHLVEDLDRLSEKITRKFNSIELKTRDAYKSISLHYLRDAQMHLRQVMGLFNPDFSSYPDSEIAGIYIHHWRGIDKSLGDYAHVFEFTATSARDSFIETMQGEEHPTDPLKAIWRRR